MTNFVMMLAVVAFVALHAGPAGAQCLFGSMIGGSPPKAKGMKTSMVRSFAPCVGTEHPIATTQTAAGADACSPVVPPDFDGSPTLYSYSPTGGCTVSTAAKLLKDCSKAEDSAGNPLGLDGRPCHVTYVKSSCKGIVRADSVTLITGALDDGWELHMLVRMTFDDTTGDDMTVIDYPVTMSYSTPDEGAMVIETSTAEALMYDWGYNGAALPACTSMQVLSMRILDPDGNEFATPGQASSPK